MRRENPLARISRYTCFPSTFMSQESVRCQAHRAFSPPLPAGKACHKRRRERHARATRRNLHAGHRAIRLDRSCNDAKRALRLVHVACVEPAHIDGARRAVGEHQRARRFELRMTIVENVAEEAAAVLMRGNRRKDPPTKITQRIGARMIADPRADRRDSTSATVARHQTSIAGNCRVLHPVTRNC